MKQGTPDALKIKDADGNVTFAISYNEGCPSFGPKGIAFSGKSGETGNATFTGMIPAGTENKKEYVADLLCGIVANVEQLEKDVPAAAKKQAEAREKLLASITEA